MNDSVTKRLSALRMRMKERGIDVYVIPSSDFHGSEYTGDYFKAREYATGFNGSAGTAVILADSAYLWTDGRYFIQAEKQLKGSGVLLQRAGEEGVPSIEDFLKKNLLEGGVIGFDGRVVSAETGEKYQKIAEEKKGGIFWEEDLVGAVWKDRPHMSKEPFFFLEEQYFGRSAAEKISCVRKKMKEAGAKAYILASLCDIAWLLNVRGNDIRHVPVVLSYLVLTGRECIWFVQEGVVKEDQREYFEKNRIGLRPYEEIYAYAASLSDTAVLLDPEKVNYRIAGSIPENAKKIIGKNPTESMKAVKNKTETDNTIRAHIKDGVAVTKFIFWLKKRVGTGTLTELSAAEYLEKMRKEQEHFLDTSFDTICAYGENAAMMHYAAEPGRGAALKPEGFLLVDSGGHYLEGTTDITRTIALGPVTEQMKRHFTAVLRGCINLASARFLYGARGQDLDILAREPLFCMGLDYKCGTGHGVGHLLSVHEGPNAFRFGKSADRAQTAVLEEGMVTTDEPGVYLKGAYGIRTENELLCQKAEKNEYGQFMRFETITYAPIDLDAVIADDMTQRERAFLNEYHRKVYETLAFYLTEEEKLWLKENTRAI